MEVYDLRLRGTHRFPDGKTPFVVVGVEDVEAGVVTQSPSPDFTIEINSNGLTMIRCHRMLTPESLAELRDKLGRLAPGEGRAS